MTDTPLDDAALSPIIERAKYAATVKMRSVAVDALIAELHRLRVIETFVDDATRLRSEVAGDLKLLQDRIEKLRAVDKGVESSINAFADRNLYERDLAVAEAVRNEIVELCQGSPLVFTIRALDLDAIVKGVKT